jgi:glutamate/tyrosine decarboxylase-like PLP-dependent enzyme
VKKQFDKELIDNVLDKISSYYEKNLDSSTPVINYKPATELVKELDLNFTDSGTTNADLLKEIDNYLKFSPRTSHPQFNNQLTGGFSNEAVLGDLISIVCNATMATYEVAPVATLMEAHLVSELNSILGFKTESNKGDGIMLTGGSNANMMAIHCARQRKFPESKMKGNGNKQMCVYISEEAHYSHRKAMLLMGLGLDNLITVKADSAGRMCIEDLKNKVQTSIDQGKTPLLVCSTAGTTVLGAFDPIAKINLIAKEFDLWHHIDGAWGGGVMFSKKYKHLLGGAGEADSLTFDAHKLMGSGLITSFFLTKHENALVDSNSGGGSQYIFHEYENAEFDTGKKSLQCGRKVDSLKFWLMWKAKGHSGLESFVNTQYEKQNYFVELIKKNPRLELVHKPEFLNVCFQVKPLDETIDINKYNFDLRFRLVKEGKMLTNFSSFSDGTVFFRHILANNMTENVDLEHLLNHLLEM